MQRRLLLRLAAGTGLAVGAAGLLALASYLTSHEDWEGGYPKGEFRVTVVDPDGRPVPGANLRGPGGGPGLTADPAGRVTITQPRGGFQFGGSRWWLFWAIPIGTSPPEYVWEVAADGFRPRRVGWQEVGAARRSSAEPTVIWRDEDRAIELPVYEVTVALER
jgi:hypothetical protein